MITKIIKILWILVASLVVAANAVLLSGCMVGPDYSRPDTSATDAPAFVYTGKHFSDPNTKIHAPWWRSFADPTTSQLIEQALRNNNDLQAAAARVLQSQAILEEIRGRQLPDIGYNFARSRAKNSFNFGGERFSALTTTFSQDISVSYIVDLFGKLKRSERASWADLLAAQASAQAVENAIISSVAKARANIATIQRQLEISRANTENWRRSLEIIERRYSRGLVGPLDVRLARENFEASKASEITVEILLVRARNALDVLLGNRPGTGESLAKTLPELPDLAPIPVGIPAQLLDRRPDLIAAEMALEASSERIGVSIAELYPALTLTGAYGRSADIFDDLFIDETEVYSAVIRVTQPIFKGGQLRARVRGAEARYQELAANYAQTVLTALQEVEDALAREQLLQQRLVALEVRFNEAIAAEKLARQRYARGVEQLITVLETERRRRIAENELNLIKGELWTGRVDLFLALGGDWTG